MAEDGQTGGQNDSDATVPLRPLEGRALEERLAKAEARRKQALAERKAKGPGTDEPSAERVLPRAIEVDASGTPVPHLVDEREPRAAAVKDDTPAIRPALEEDMPAEEEARRVEILDAEAFERRLAEARERRQAALEARKKPRPKPAEEKPPVAEKPAAKVPFSKIPGVRRAGVNPSNYTVVVEKLPDPGPRPEPEERRGVPLAGALAASLLAAVCVASAAYVFRDPIMLMFAQAPDVPGGVDEVASVSPGAGDGGASATSIRVVDSARGWNPPQQFESPVANVERPSEFLLSVLDTVAPETTSPVRLTFGVPGEMPQVPGFPSELFTEEGAHGTPAGFETTAVEAVPTGLPGPVDQRPEVRMAERFTLPVDPGKISGLATVTADDLNVPDVMTLASVGTGSVAHPDRIGPVYPFLWRPDELAGLGGSVVDSKAELAPRNAALVRHGSPEPLVGYDAIQEDGGSLDELVTPGEALAAEEEVTPMAFTQTRVPVHYPSNAGSSAANAVALLRANGVDQSNAVPVGFSISRSNVRYYFDSDREAAQKVVDVLNAGGQPGGVELRDFTDFRPSPERGMIEVWLSGEPQRSAAAPQPAAPAVRQQPAAQAPSSREMQELEALRQRRQAMVEQLLRQQLSE